MENLALILTISALAVLGGVTIWKIKSKKEAGPKKLTSIEHLRKLINNRPKKTQTFLIPEEIKEEAKKVIDLVKPLSEYRQLTPKEVNEIADYLKVDVEQLQGPFYVDKEQICPKCSRKNTFLDITKTAIEQDIHVREMIIDVITGTRDYWVTIFGTGDMREFFCLDCGSGVVQQGYKCDSYAWI